MPDASKNYPSAQLHRYLLERKADGAAVSRTAATMDTVGEKVAKMHASLQAWERDWARLEALR